MSGAGSYAAGTGSPAGLGVPVPGTDVTVLTACPSYDPLLRIVEPALQVHWVDQVVPFLLGNEKGSLPSMPDAGLDRARIRFATKLNAQKLIEDVVVNDCLASLLARGAIEIDHITVEFKFGSPAFEVGYRNLLSSDAKPRQFKVT